MVVVCWLLFHVRSFFFIIFLCLFRGPAVNLAIWLILTAVNNINLGINVCFRQEYFLFGRIVEKSQDVCPFRFSNDWWLVILCYCYMRLEIVPSRGYLKILSEQPESWHTKNSSNNFRVVMFKFRTTCFGRKYRTKYALISGKMFVENCDFKSKSDIFFSFIH